MSSHRFCLALLAVFTVVAGVYLFAADSLLAGVSGSPHDFSSTGPYTKTLAPSGVCSVCHIPHGAKDAVLWPRFLGDATSGYRRYLNNADGTGDNNYLYGQTLQCYDCHDYAGNLGTFTGDMTTPPVSNILDNTNADPPKGSFTTRHRPQDVAFGLTPKTVLPPGGGYDGDWTDDGPGGTVPGYFENDPPNNFPLQDLARFGVRSPTGTPRIGGHYFKSGDPLITGTGINSLKRGGKIPCSDCHDPHDYTVQAFIRKSVRDIPGAILPINSAASEYMSNKGPAGKNRSNNGDSRNMCNVCHTLEGSTIVTYKQINPGYEAINVVQRPNTIPEHLGGIAPCTQCHSHNNIAGNCVQCHGYPPSRTATPAYPASPRFVPSAPVDNDSHPRHYGASSGEARTGLYQFGCEVCHYLSTGAGSQSGIHQNGKVSVVLQGPWTKNGGAYDNANYFNPLQSPVYPPTVPPVTPELDNGITNSGWGSPSGTSYGGNACRNVYCHSAGRVQTSMGLDCTVDYRVPRWNSGPLHCNDCHGSIAIDNANIAYGMPNYPSGLAGTDSANTHRQHVVNARMECSVCHFGTVNSGDNGANRSIKVTTPTLHVNNLRDVGFDGQTAVPRSGNGYTPGTKSCSVFCHAPANLPQWGGTLSCDGCHQPQGAGTVTVPQTYTGVHSSHSVPLAGNYGFACEVCHAEKAATHPNRVHINGDNSATPRYVEVYFTDNASNQSYDNTGSFRSFDMYAGRYGASWSPTYVDNVQGGVDGVNGNITWSMGSCANVWCHSNANPIAGGGAGGTPLRATPRWDNTKTGSCTICHGGAGNFLSMGVPTGLSGAHRAHVATDRYAFTCDECHANTVAADCSVLIRNDGVVNGYTYHVNGNKYDIKGPPSVRTSVQVANEIFVYDNGATRSCATNNYCHSQGQKTIVPFDPPNTTTAAAWDNDGALGTKCTGCHGGDLSSGKPISTGKHLEHLQQGYRCADCHNRTMDNGVGKDNTALHPTTGYANHVNGRKDVNSPYFAAGSCISVTCHSGSSYDNTVFATVWAPAAILPSCFDCHSGPYSLAEKIYKPQLDYDNAAIPNPVNATEYGTSGHGRPTTLGAYPGGNPAAGFDCVAVVDASSCYLCHSTVSTKHGLKDVNDPFRLGYGSDVIGQNSTVTQGAFADNTDALCLKCHGAVTGGPPLAQVTRNMATHSKAITGGSKNWPGPDYPWKCVDCHDPHGDNNWKMIRSAINTPSSNLDVNVGSNSQSITRRTIDVNVRPVTFSSDNGFFANSYAIPGVGNWGICEVCHTQTNAYSRTLDNAASHGSRTGTCTVCHVHTAAFRGLGGPDVGQYFDRLAFANYPDNSSHPLRGLTTADTVLRFAGAGSENCLGCHYGSGSGKASDECLMCHFENVGSGGTPAALGTQHMDKAIQLATIPAGNTLPTSAFAITTITDYDNWCLQCHGTTTISLGNRVPSAANRTVISASGFTNGRHRAVIALAGGPVGCIYCHQPHGRSNARIVRENPSNRASAGATPMRFGVYPTDNVGGYTGKYRAVADDIYNYRARTDTALPNVFADADDDQNFCAKACHTYKIDPAYAKDKMIKRDGATGNYVLAGTKKIYLIGGAEYTSDNLTTLGTITFHVHYNGDIIPTNDMINYYANIAGPTGPSFYRYPGEVGANPANPSVWNVTKNAASALPFFPDYSPDGNRDFTNAYNGLGVPIRYRSTCSTCHDPHGNDFIGSNTPGSRAAYPDLRLRSSPPDLCRACHK